jgi:hypothetical protein
MLSIHLRLGLPSGLFPSGFPTNNLYTFLLFSPIRTICPAHLILLDYFSEYLVAPGIEPGTSESVARNSDHWTTEKRRNKVVPMKHSYIELSSNVDKQRGPISPTAV